MNLVIVNSDVCLDTKALRQFKDKPHTHILDSYSLKIKYDLKFTIGLIKGKVLYLLVTIFISLYHKSKADVCSLEAPLQLNV